MTGEASCFVDSLIVGVASTWVRRDPPAHPTKGASAASTEV